MLFMRMVPLSQWLVFGMDHGLPLRVILSKEGNNYMVCPMELPSLIELGSPGPKPNTLPSKSLIRHVPSH